MQSYDVISKAIKDNPILPHSQQLSLVKLWQNTANKNALDKLVLSNMRAVTKEASRIKSKNHYLSYDDLIQEGIAGLLKAADMFDVEQEVNFLTYAMWWIKANMRKHVMSYRSIVKMGTTRDDRVLFSNLSKSLREAEELGLSGELSFDFVAKQLSVSKDSIRQMAVTLKGFDTRLDAPIGNEEGSEVRRVNLIEDESISEDIILAINQNKFLSSILSEIVKDLPSDERAIIENRFLIDTTKTLRELAKEMKISREWVRKLESKALDRIRKRLASQYNIREV